MKKRSIKATIGAGRFEAINFSMAEIIKLALLMSAVLLGVNLLNGDTSLVVVIKHLPA